MLASSNHAVGWAELDDLSGLSAELPVTPWSVPRPDGLYGAVKVFVEALARAAAECLLLPVSLLRIGTVRLDDDPAHAVAGPDFGYVGDAAAVTARLARTWLHHADLVAMVREELAAPDLYRLRYGTSDTRQELWSREVYIWNPA